MTRKKYHNHLDKQSNLSPPLFAWAESVRRSARPFAVSHIQRLCGVSPSVAQLYAELAGLCVGEQK
jgi:hypothetical protein